MSFEEQSASSVITMKSRPLPQAHNRCSPPVGPLPSNLGSSMLPSLVERTSLGDFVICEERESRYAVFTVILVVMKDVKPIENTCNMWKIYTYLFELQLVYREANLFSRYC